MSSKRTPSRACSHCMNPGLCMDAQSSEQGCRWKDLVLLERGKWNEGVGSASIAGVPAEPGLVLGAAGGERGGGHPTTQSPPRPSPSGTGGRVRPAPFTGVEGNGGAMGRRRSPPKHMRCRCARSESQPIRNIIYNNNNNNINNIRTSGSVFFSIYHLAGGRASGWHDNRYFCFQFSPSSAAAVTQRQALAGTLSRPHRCHSRHHWWQKHLKSPGFEFPLWALS